MSLTEFIKVFLNFAVFPPFLPNVANLIYFYAVSRTFFCDLFLHCVVKYFSNFLSIQENFDLFSRKVVIVFAIVTPFLFILVISDEHSFT